MSVVDLAQRTLVDPFTVPFVQRALVELVLLGAVGAAVGVHVVLRRQAFLTEALQHTVFPGIAVAYALQASLLLGAAVAAVLTLLLLGPMERRPRTGTDAALALLVTTFFAVGVVVVSRRTSFQHDLTSLLFGRILAVDRAQVLQTAVIAIVVVVVLAALHKELVARAFDAEGMRALGFRIGVLDLVLNVMVALVVIAAVRAVGTVLLVAFVVTPAATGRMLGRSVVAAMVIGAALAVISSWLGLGLAYERSMAGVDLPPGSTVVLVLTGTCLLALALVGAPRSLRRRWSHRQAAHSIGSAS